MQGLSKDRVMQRHDESMYNSFWVYDLKAEEWHCVYKNDTSQRISSGDKEDGKGQPSLLYRNHSSSTDKLFSSAPNPTHESFKPTWAVKKPKLKKEKPCPRYAHQLAYDPVNKVREEEG